MSSVTKTAPAAEIAVSISRPCILIVDDDENFLDEAREYFTACGCDVDTALTPEEATLILQKEGKNKYQLIVTDYDFGDLSDIKGDKFARENRHLFGKAKIVIISGAQSMKPEIHNRLKAAEARFLEKNMSLNKTLQEITQRENQKRTQDIEKIVKKETAPRIKEITGRPVDIRIVSGAAATATAAAPAPAPQPERLPDVLVQRLKRTLIKWLSTRSERDRPMLACGNEVYSANQMIEQVKNETEVGLEHIQMLLVEFEHSLKIDEEASRQYDDKYPRESGERRR